MNRTARQWLLDLSAIFFAVLLADIAFNHLSQRVTLSERVSVVSGGECGGGESYY